MDKSQLGRAGELALSLYTLVTSNGEIELYDPVVDDDHVDLVAARKGDLPKLALQVKTAEGLDRHGEVEAIASYPAGEVREHPAFLYAVPLLDGTAIAALWLVPSPDFNRLAYRHRTGAREVLEFRARPGGDARFGPFELDPREIGPRLLALIAGTAKPLPEAWWEPDAETR